MKITERLLKGVTVLDLDGKLNMNANKMVKDRVAAAINNGSRKVVLNLAAVRYIDSSGLGEIVACYTNMHSNGGIVKLLNLDDKLQNLLITTKLITIFEIFNSESEAVSSFGV